MNFKEKLKRILLDLVDNICETAEVEFYDRDSYGVVPIDSVRYIDEAIDKIMKEVKEMSHKCNLIYGLFCPYNYNCEQCSIRHLAELGK